MPVVPGSCWAGGAEVQTARALEPPGDPHTDHGEPRHGGHPCRLLPPPGGDCRRVCAPATARCHGRGLLLRRLEHRSRGIDLRATAAPPLRERGHTQRLEEVAPPLSLACGPRAPRLAPRPQALLCHPWPHLLERRVAIPPRQVQGCAPPPPREPLGGGGGSRRSSTGATSRRRHTPRPRGLCALGYTGCTAIALKHLLGSSPPGSLRAESRLRRPQGSHRKQKSHGAA